MTRLPDGSGFFVAEINPDAPKLDPIRWNPYNRVVQDHRDGTVDLEQTNIERQVRGLPVPWTREIAAKELGLDG